jgi:hypothetical protein
MWIKILGVAFAAICSIVGIGLFKEYRQHSKPKSEPPKKDTKKIKKNPDAPLKAKKRVYKEHINNMN